MYPSTPYQYNKQNHLATSVPTGKNLTEILPFVQMFT